MRRDRIADPGIEQKLVVYPHRYQCILGGIYAVIEKLGLPTRLCIEFPAANNEVSGGAIAIARAAMLANRETVQVTV